MWKPHFALCQGCDKETLIVVKKGLCKLCNELQKRNGSIRSSIKRVRKATGEAEVFRQIWNERDHICEHCKRHLGDEPKAHYFSHILSKKAVPELRLAKSNIRCLCLECHHEWDHGTKEKFTKRKNLYARKTSSF